MSRCAVCILLCLSFQVDHLDFFVIYLRILFLYVVLYLFVYCVCLCVCGVCEYLVIVAFDI